MVRRAASGLVVVWVVVTLAFALFFLAPHDVARTMVGQHPDPQIQALITHRLGLDQPVWRQYLSFLSRAVHGDLGYDYYHDVPVTELLAAAFPVTLSVVLGAALVFPLVGVAGGILSAVRPHTVRERAVTVLSLLCYSVPSFALALVLIYFCYFRLTTNGVEIFPPGGYAPLREGVVPWLQHLLLPWTTLILISAAGYARLVRNSMLDVLAQDHIRAARAKGLRERRVVVGHGLRNAAGPAVTQFGVDLGWLLGGAVAVEIVFGLPGLGKLSIDAVDQQDLPVIMGTVLVGTVAVVVANTVADIVYAVVDPRIRPH